MSWWCIDIIDIIDIWWLFFCMGLIYNDKCSRIDLKIALTCFHQAGNCSSTNPLLCNWPVRLVFYLMPHASSHLPERWLHRLPEGELVPWHPHWFAPAATHLGGIEKVSALQGYGHCWPVNHSAVGDGGGWPSLATKVQWLRSDRVP